MQLTIPPIAQPWPGQGGVYCGLVRGVDGQPDHHLILALPRPPKRLKWQAALDWAATVNVDGHADFTVPTPAENAVLFGNVPELFERTWYWSNKAEGASYAWFCYFGNGYQDCDTRHRRFDGRAVAVRRLPVGPSALPEAHIPLQAGEHYAGAVLDEDGRVKHHLVLMAPRASDVTWQAATDWAASVGGALPTRQEQALLFANCKPHLEESWHWSAETNGASYAWICYFGYGDQSYLTRSFGRSAVAVRRLPVGPSVLWADEAATAAVA